MNDATIGAGAFLLITFLLVVSFGLYFIPTWIALGRAHPNRLAIFLINLLLGWSAIGWFVAFVWALIIPQPIKVVMVREEPTLR